MNGEKNYKCGCGNKGFIIINNSICCIMCYRRLIKESKNQSLDKCDKCGKKRKDFEFFYRTKDETLCSDCMKKDE